MSIPPPARAGRGAAAHSRSTIDVTGRSGVNAIRSVPLTAAPSNETVAESRGRCGSGAAYDGGHDGGADDVADTAVGPATEDANGAAEGEAERAGAEADNAAVGVAVLGAADGLVPVLHAAARATTTTQPVRIGRR